MENARNNGNKLGRESDRDKQTQIVNAAKFKEEASASIFKNKKVLAIGGGVLGAVITLVVAIVIISNAGKDYKVVDLTEMSITEACSTARSHGWKIEEPIEAKDYYSSKAVREIDCDNTTAKVADYEYRDSNHSVLLKYNAKVDVKGKNVEEAVRTLKEAGWKDDSIELLRCNGKSCGSGSCLTIGDYSSYSTDEPIVLTYFDRTESVKIFLEANEEEERSSNSGNSSGLANPSSDSSSSSSSSSTNSSNDMCKSDYQSSLDTAKTAYEMAKKNYETYKSMPNADPSILSTYQSGLDTAKTSLDTAQKIYDTYCK